MVTLTHKVSWFRRSYKNLIGHKQCERFITASLYSLAKWGQVNLHNGGEREGERERGLSSLLVDRCMCTCTHTCVCMMHLLNWCEMSESLARLFIRAAAAVLEKKETDWDDTYRTVEWARQSNLDNEQKLTREKRKKISGAFKWVLDWVRVWLEVRQESNRETCKWHKNERHERRERKGANINREMEGMISNTSVRSIC